MFSKSVNLFFKNPIIGLPSVLLATVTSLFARFMFGTTYLKNFDSNSITGIDKIPVELARTVSLFLLYLILTILLQPMIQAFTILLSKNALDRNNASFSDTFKLSFRYYWRLLGVLVFKLFLLIAICIGAIFAVMPSMTKFVSNPQSFPVGLVLMFFCLVLLIILFSILLLPIEPILIYEDLSLGDSISKGFKFGFKKLPSLIGVSFLVGICAAIINYIISLVIGDITEISSIITSYFSVIITIYILCIYKENIDKSNFKEPLHVDIFKDNLLNDNQMNENTGNNSGQGLNEKSEIVEEKKDDSNKFIV
jgi:hypothetical protein